MQTDLEHWTTAIVAAPLAVPSLSRWIDGFLLARRAEGRAAGTLSFYKLRLTEFAAFCQARSVSTVEAVDALLCREWMISLAECHNSGGVMSYYRSLSAFLLWYADEAAGDGWRNPLAKVKPPKVDLPPLPPANMADIAAMLAACKGIHASRDKAILFTLLDIGLRASELCGLTLADFEQVTGALTVTRSKSHRPRTVYLGKRARVAVRAYLRERGDKPGALFVSQDGAKFTVNGLRQVVKRRARDAGIKSPPLHAFRRAAALALVRNGADLLTVSRVLGHAGLSLLQRYVNQNGDDLRAAAERYSPADKL